MKERNIAVANLIMDIMSLNEEQISELISLAKEQGIITLDQDGEESDN